MTSRYLSKSIFTALFACVFLVSCVSYEKNMFRTVTFDAAEAHWRSILPFHFIKTPDKNQWHYNENVVFQITILKIPEGKDHIEWRKNIQKNFFNKRGSFSVISENMVSFKNWHGTKIQIKDRVDFCTYWFLSDEKFFMFVSLIDREFNGHYPNLSELDNFFFYLETDESSLSCPKIHL